MWGLWASAARASAFGSRADVRTKPTTQNEAAKTRSQVRLCLMSVIGTKLCYWHKADIPAVLPNVRFWG
jgi:hypothetical protein